MAVSSKRLGRSFINQIVEYMRKSSADQTVIHEHNEGRQGEFRHGDGWGCTWLNSFGHLRFYRSLIPLYEEDMDELDKVFSHAADSPFFMIHTRKASPKLPIRVEYIHPFVRSTRLGQVAFVHNGTIQEYETMGLVNYAEEILTNSDSERLLYYLVGRLEMHRDDDIKALKNAIENIPMGSTANYFLVLENPFVAYASANYTKTPKYLTMHYASNDDTIVISSEQMKLTGLENWNTLSNGELIKIDRKDNQLSWKKY